MELSVVEQRYRAVLAALAGATVTEVAARWGVAADGQRVEVPV
jgi:transposase-like protein